MNVATIARWLYESTCTVAFTGAGISTESGIPDFRSPGGVWSKYQPVYFDEFVESAAARVRYWQQKSEGHTDFARAGPNPGHLQLAEWQRRGLLRGVITQNIDGLHQMAGSENVLELHGTARRVGCLGCDFSDVADAYVALFLATGNVPDCPACGLPLKHATISFGQALPAAVLAEAEAWAEDSALFLAAGSSLLVTPAADLPRVAVDSGARLVIINRDPTPLDTIASAVIREPIGQTLPAIARAFREMVE